MQMSIGNIPSFIKNKENSPNIYNSYLNNIFELEKKQENNDLNIINDEFEEFEENYIKINTKNQYDIYNTNESNNKLNEIIKYVDESIEEKSTTENISEIFLEKLFPKCELKAFLISKFISKRLMKSKKINHKIIEEKIMFFFQQRMDIRYSKKLFLDKEAINNIGYILCYSYTKFENFFIFDKKDLKNVIKKMKAKDSINDFYSFCNENGKSPLDYSLLTFLENKKEYRLPGEFLFLINIFDCIKILEINMDINIDKSKEDHSDDFFLFVITHLNIHYLVNFVDQFKVNFYNQQLQNDLFSYFNEELKSFYKNNNRYLKKNFQFDKNELFKVRWDFEKDYIIKNKKIFSFNKDDENTINNNNSKEDIINNSDNTLFTSFIDADLDKSKESLFRSIILGRNRAISFFNKPNYINSSIIRSNTLAIPEIDELLSLDKGLNRNNSLIERFDKRKIKSKYDKLIEKHKNILELIYIVILSILRLKNLKNLDLIINDCYYKEIINCFRQNYFSSKLATNLNNFHLLNNFIKKMTNIESLNIEFNSLDYLTFYNFLSILKKNENLNSLKISFFSSYITYSLEFIYKLYKQNNDKNEVNQLYSPESFILKELLPYFIENLEAFFELIRTKMNKLQILSFNFDVPEIVAFNQRYLIGILKFILNILLFVDNKNSNINKLVILSPKTTIDSRSFPNIVDIFDTINFEKNNKKIKELSIQMQLYQIINIKNIISRNLISLKIGEVDISTLHGLTKYLCSISFFKKSSLEFLGIGLLYYITHFTKEIEYLLNELFSIRIKTLKEINIYSNILIKNKKSYYKILENNWISSCILTLNEKSKFSWKQNKIEEKINQIIGNKKKVNENIHDKKILYLVHHELEDQILIPNELAKRKKKQYAKTNCEVIWYLRYLLINKFSKQKKIKFNYYDLKNIIFNILKFLYFTKTTKIENEKE